MRGVDKVPWSRRTSRTARFRRWRGPLFFVSVLAPALLIGSQVAAPVPVAAAPTGFSFNWTGTPAAPLDWVPRPTNDWDLDPTNGNVESTDIAGGPFQGGHGADCGAPPSTHPITKLADSVYICNNHMMTAENNSDAFFTPNQIVDFSHGTATVTWQVSTARLSQRDWWDVWLTPFMENFVTPVDDAPFFEGNPDDALHITMVQRNGCTQGQPSFPPNGQGQHDGGTSFGFSLYKGGNKVAQGGDDARCMEDAAGGPSARARSTFELDISQGHVKFGMHGAGGDATWIDSGVSLPFNQSVITWAHRSYSPMKACTFVTNGSCGPGTFHWSNFAISPSVPFSMLRPIGTGTVHDGSNTTVTLPMPAPANSFLRFSAFGNIRVSYDQAGSASPHMQDTGWRFEGMSSYLSPVPAGTRTISFSGSTRGGMAWWMEDVSVWALTAPLSQPASAPVNAPPAKALPAAARPYDGPEHHLLAPQTQHVAAKPGPPGDPFHRFFSWVSSGWGHLWHH